MSNLRGVYVDAVGLDVQSVKSKRYVLKYVSKEDVELIMNGERFFL